MQAMKVRGAVAFAAFDPAAFMTGRSWKGALLGGEKPRSAIPRLADWYERGFLRLDHLISHRLTRRRSIRASL